MITVTGIPDSDSARAIFRPASSGLPSVTTTENWCPRDAARRSKAKTTREWPWVRSVEPGLTNRAPRSAMVARARVEVAAKWLPRCFFFFFFVWKERGVN